MASKDLRRVDDQQELPLGRKATPIALDPILIHRQPNALAALNLMINASGLEDKEIYLPLGIDAGHWTRIRQGSANPPLNKLDELIDLCGNDAFLEYVAHRRGFGLVPLRSELERQLEEERARRLEAEQKLQTILDYEAAKAGRR